MAEAAISFLMDLSQKLIRNIIRNTYRTSLPNLKAIKPTVHKLSCPQAFWAAILENVGFCNITNLISSVAIWQISFLLVLHGRKIQFYVPWSFQKKIHFSRFSFSI